MKISKSNVFSFILGAIIFSSVTYAATLLARDITYDNTNSNISADTVQEAIDVLYTKANQTIPDTYKDLSTPVTATSSDILNGKTAYKHDGTILTGSIGTYTGTTIYDPTYETITIPTAGKYLTNDIVINGISSTYKNLTTTTTVTANALLSGIVAYNQSGQTVTGNISTYNVSGHVTPTTSSQTLSTGGKYVNGDIVVDAIPSTYKNISDSTITTAGDVLSGLVAYKADGTKITGTGTHNCFNNTLILNSSISTSTGQKLIDNNNYSYILQYIVSNDFLALSYSDISTGYIYFYNNNNNSLSSNNNVSAYRRWEISRLYRIDSSGIYAINWGSEFVGKSLTIVACK